MFSLGCGYGARLLLSTEVAVSGIFSSSVCIHVKVCICDLELVLLHEWGRKGRKGPNIIIITLREGTNLC